MGRGGHATTFVMCAAAVAIVGCSGGGDDGTDRAIAVATVVEATGSGDVTTADVSADTTVLPPILDTDTAALTRGALDGTPLGAWVALAAPPDVLAATDPCALAANPPMDAILFEDASLIADAVLGELLLNLDAEQSAMRSLCATETTEEAATTAADIQRTITLIDKRLVEVGAR